MPFWSFHKSDRDKYLSEARKCQRRGEYDRAGDYFFMAGAEDEALEMYLKGGQHKLAAQILEKKRDLRRAADLYVQARELRTAAELYMKLGDGKRASQLFEKIGEHFKAAQAEEAARAYRRAAELYLKAGHLERAAHNYSKDRDYLRAAETLEDHLGSQNAAGDKEALRTQWNGCAELYYRAERYHKAAQIWERLGAHARAAESYEKAQEFSKAVATHLKNGDLARAYQIFQSAPDGSVELLTRAELLYARGDWLPAGQLFASLGEHGRAGECFEKAGERAEAAEEYEKAGSWEVAADLFYGVGQYGRASELYESAMRYVMAARAAMEGGQLERAARLYADAHEPVEAARCFERLGQLDKAIAALQQIASGHEAYSEACRFLGDLFREKGIHSIAAEKYQAAINGRGVDDDTIDAYYGLAVLAEGQGDLARASELYERIVASSISYRDASQRLASLRGRLKGNGTLQPIPAPAFPADGETQVLPVDGAPTAGSMFGPRYEVVARIGTSSRGDVYKAWDSSLGRTVVLKRLTTRSEAEEGQLKRYIHEAQQASKLHHSNVATIYDAVEATQGRYVATEYVFGDSLAAVLRRDGPLTASRAVEIASQVALALEYAHGLGVTHRNLRPENILISEKAHVKLTDFGMNRRLADLRNDPYSESSALHYISPEQIRGDKVDHRADVYALGCILCEMLTGSPPFQGPDVIAMHLEAEPEVKPEPRGALPASLVSIILRCLEKDPDKRFASARQVYEQLRSFDFMPGLRIGDRYELLRELGSGGMGKVFMARDLELDEVIAMKVLRPEFGTDLQLEQRFIREIKLARKIVHPSVVKVYDFGKWRNVKYITMEYIDGTSLDEYVRLHHPPPVAEVVDFLIQICGALEAAHALGVVHRDIKPQNVLVSSAKRAKLVDFGIARLNSFEDLTSSRLIIGSPKYMSPEQVSGAAIDHRTDIYSLGVVAYYCLTGIEPFTADDTNAIIMKQLHENPVPPSQVNPELPAGVEMVILRCLVKDAAGRYQHAREVSRDLLAQSRP